MLNYKTSLITLCIIFVSSFNVSMAAQPKYEDFSWKSPNNWEGAIFDVPTWFAKDMLYSGREVIRFHDGFYDAKSVGFWTYAFGLLVDQTETPTTAAITEETKRYFLGLARVLGDNKQENYPPSKIIVIPKSEWRVSKDGLHRTQLYQLDSFDSFTTGKSIQLNVKITTWLCSKKHRAIHYTISPQNRSHPIWDELNKEIDALKCG